MNLTKEKPKKEIPLIKHKGTVLTGTNWDPLLYGEVRYNA